MKNVFAFLFLSMTVNLNAQVIDDGKNFDWGKEQNINVIELRNYLLKPGQSDAFIAYFEENFIKSQNNLGAYILGQYTVKGADDNFLWIRGFHDMPSRNTFLNDFYHGSFWKEHKQVPNSLLLNNDNVYLLKPLAAAEPGWFGMDKGIAVIDFYTSNTKLDRLIELVKNKYNAVLHNAGIRNTSFWTSELSTNEFTALPVFQDKNLLVQITFYKNEPEYQMKMKQVNAAMSEELKLEMADMVTIKNTLIIYPAKNLL